jgi:sigma-B regulation protein RsbU (phosphoserine phosphatase)
MFKDTSYASREDVVLEPGETLVMLTDGVTELENRAGERMGSQAALDVIGTHRREPADRLVSRLSEAAESFAQRRVPTDDITIVICKRL